MTGVASCRAADAWPYRPAEYVLEQGAADDEVRVPVPGVLLDCDGGWLLLDTGFNTALITDPRCAAGSTGTP